MPGPDRILLREQLSEGLAPERAQLIGMNLGYVVAAVHGQEGPHGSLRPDTIAVANDNTVELRASEMDPTLSVIEELAGHGSDVSLAQAPYISPERALGASPSVPDDVFAIGAVLYELVTGSPPFTGQTREEILTEVSLATPRDVLELNPHAPRALARVIHRCLKSRAENRFPSAEAIAEELERIINPKKAKHRTTQRSDALPPDVVPEPSAYDDEPLATDGGATLRRLRATVAGLVALVIIATAGAVYFAILPNSHLPNSNDEVHAAADPRTLLILPLEIRGRSDDTRYLGRAFADSLAINLALDATLRVLPVPLATEFKSVEDRTRRARHRGAGKLLTGSLARNNGELTASLSLVDTIENRVVWGTTERDRSGDYNHLAVTLVQRLGGYLGSNFPRMYPYITHLTGGRSMASDPITATVIAALRTGDIDTALQASETLVERFPEEADARALRAHALLLRWDAQRSPDDRSNLDSALETLRQIDENSPYVPFYRAYIDFVTGDVEAAATAYALLLQRDDLSPRARAWVLKYRASVDQAQNDSEAALEAIDEALRIDPANPWTLAILAENLITAERYEEALVRARQAISLAPTFWRNHLTLGHALARLERWDEAASAQEKACDLSKAQMPCALHAIGLLNAGKAEAAAKKADEALALEASPAGLYNLACFFARTGNTEKSLDVLEDAADLGHRTEDVYSDEDLESLRNDERFEAIAKRIAGR